MKLAAGVVAILVLPVVVYAIDPSHQTLFFRVTLGVFLTVGVGLLVFSATLRPSVRPDRSMDEPALDRRLAIAALLGAMVIASFTLLAAKALTPFISGVTVVWSLVWLLPFTRRISVTTHVLINRDLETVFAFMADMRNQPQYVPEVVSVQKVTEGDIGPGTQFRSTIRFDDMTTFEGVDEIVELEWGRRFTDRVASGTRRNYGVMTFDPIGAATQISYRFVGDVTYAGAVLGQGLLRWAVTGKMRRKRMEAWARLKQVLESRPDA